MADILSGKAAGQHAYKDTQSDADTNHDFSSVQWVVLLGMCTGIVWSESTSEAFQRLCPTTTFVPTTAVGHDRGGRLGLLFQITPQVTVSHPPSM